MDNHHLEFLIFGIIVAVISAYLLINLYLNERVKKPTHPKRTIRIKIFFYLSPNFKTGGYCMELSVPAKVGKKFYGHIDPQDADKDEVEIKDGSEVYSSSDETIFTVITNPKNPKYFIGTLTGKVGVAKLQVNLDPDAADVAGTELLSDTATVTVTPDIATSVNIEFDDTDDAPDVTSNPPVV